jgi:trk system potassium uptake protein TrkH
MYFGASPSGTGGGLKSTTITATIAYVKCKLGEKRNIYISGHKLPTFRVDNALTTFVLYTAILFFGSYILTAVEPSDDYVQYLFESASALGTVGLSTGITPTLTSAGKMILIILMYIGRVGVLTIGFSMMKRMEKKTVSAIKEMKVLKNDDLAV